MRSTKFKMQLLRFFPIIGIILFMGCYLVSASLYPGGSQYDVHSKGFNWLHNYWCNLTSVQAINGAPNTARPVAIFGLVLLCISLLLFFVHFAVVWRMSKLWRRLIVLNGCLSMFFASFIFTNYHDLMTILASAFGALVVIGIIKGVYASKFTAHKFFGMFCLLLLVLNNWIYYSTFNLEWLPLIQKVTFAMVLAWLLGLNLLLIKINESND